MFCPVSKPNKEIKAENSNYSTSACLPFCLQLDKLKHVSHEEFELVNWLPVTQLFKQCFKAVVFKYFSEQCSNDLNEAFDVARESKKSIKSSLSKIKMSIFILCRRRQ